MVASSAIALQRTRAAIAKGRKPKVEEPAAAPAYSQRPEADVVRLLLPVPVSVNAIYERHPGGGVRLSKAYSAWLSEAGWRLNVQRPGRVSGRYQLTLRMPEESGLDLDNSIKAVSDLMQLHGVVRNDRLASRIVLEWQSEQPVAMVEVVPLGGAV
jgi:crossover junction endodeoxyribonuclease RusA